MDQKNMKLNEDRRCQNCEFFEYDFVGGKGYICMNENGERYNEKINRGECCNDWLGF